MVARIFATEWLLKYFGILHLSRDHENNEVLRIRRARHPASKIETANKFIKPASGIRI